jgi:hypothetical protein
MIDRDALAERLNRLEDVQALHALKAEYAKAADAKYTATFQRSPDFESAAARQVACFTEDAVWHGGSFGGTLIGHKALLDFFLNSPWRFTAHLYDAPELSIERDCASARWRLWELGIRASDGHTMLLIGTTRETYRRMAQGWKIASMRFESLHSMTFAEHPDALRCLIAGNKQLDHFM